jgi:hyperosmotically inducible protein
LDIPYYYLERRMTMRLSHKGFIIFSLFLVIGLGGCEGEGPAEKAGQKVDQAVEKAGKTIEGAGNAIGEKAEKVGEYMDDTAITAKIKAEILSDPLLKVAEINVTTTDGVVKLSGVVDSRESIDRALDIVRGIKNLKSIENGLTVKGS